MILPHGGIQQTLSFIQCSADNIGTCCKLFIHQVINLHAIYSIFFGCREKEP